MNAIDKAIAAAEARANEAAPATGTEIAMAPTANNNGVQAYAPVVPPSIDSFSAGSAMSVDEYLKVKSTTLLIGSKAASLIETIKVSIDFSEVSFNQTIKAGNPAVYFKTYDGVTCASGGSWADAVRKSQMVDGKAQPYQSADIQMTLIEDAKDVKGTVIAEKGTRLGHSLSTTNRGEFASLLKATETAGLKGGKINATIGFKKMTNKAGNEWGILTFTLDGPAQ